MFKVGGLLVLIMLMSGCAAGRVQPQVAPAASDSLPEGTGWWAVRFSINRPDGEQPDWSMGALLGGEVVAPVFERHSRDIMIWRIHRRAGNDSYGHVFSFIFYSTPRAARDIYADIAANPVLRQLQQTHAVTEVGYDDLSRITMPGVGDTSDVVWDPALQQTWPALAMGASRMWLDLVSLKAAEHSGETDLRKRYRLVQKDLNSLWATQGQHAMLHHLAAIFAYQPLLIRY